MNVNQEKKDIYMHKTMFHEKSFRNDWKAAYILETIQMNYQKAFNGNGSFRDCRILLCQMEVTIDAIIYLLRSKRTGSRRVFASVLETKNFRQDAQTASVFLASRNPEEEVADVFSRIGNQDRGRI